MKMTLIDHGFYRISERDARQLCRTTDAGLPLGSGTLPPSGYERLVVHDDQHWWLSRTHDTWGTRKVVWSIRRSSWVLIDGVAVLGTVDRSVVKVDGEWKRGHRVWNRTGGSEVVLHGEPGFIK